MEPLLVPLNRLVLWPTCNHFGVSV